MDHSENPSPAEPAMQDCPFCASQIPARAKKCSQCGETIDVALRAAEEAKNAMKDNSPNVFMNAGGGGGGAAANAQQGAAQGNTPTRIANRTKGVAALLAFFLGGFGAHRFYTGRPISGIFYLLFCWTYIPSLLAFVECIRYLCMSAREFDMKYNMSPY